MRATLSRWLHGLHPAARGLLVAINTATLYRQTERAANTAYHRTLLASAKSIGELPDVAGTP